jgi:hypothetical protein
MRLHTFLKPDQLLKATLAKLSTQTRQGKLPPMQPVLLSAVLAAAR